MKATKKAGQNGQSLLTGSCEELLGILRRIYVVSGVVHVFDAQDVPFHWARGLGSFMLTWFGRLAFGVE